MSDTTNARAELNPAEAAKLLGICPRTLWQLSHDGRIPHRAVVVGTGLRLRRTYYIETLREWMRIRNRCVKCMAMRCRGCQPPASTPGD
jgi:excisionase family DNA binding protein